MSGTLAIAAVTAALRDQLDLEVRSRFTDLVVTTRPPDRARTVKEGSQLNLFLYQTVWNTRFANSGPPWNTSSAEIGTPPVALNLRYLLTAYYGEFDDGVDSATDPNHLFATHSILGAALQTLHDSPILDSVRLTAALGALDRDDNIFDTVERARITPLDLSVEEMSKLWTSFQTNYRLSAAFEVSVAFIESARARKSALPVLMRGHADRGVLVIASQPPVLREIIPPKLFPTASLGSTIEIHGSELNRQGWALRLDHPRFSKPRLLHRLTEDSADSYKLTLPDGSTPPDTWLAGVYTLAAVAKLDPAASGGDFSSADDNTQIPDVPLLSSNELVLAVSPKLASGAQINATVGDTITVPLAHKVRKNQRIRMLVGDQEFPVSFPASPGDYADSVQVKLTGIPANAQPYRLRLRVDGVDSIPIKINAATHLPEFDDNQSVLVSP